MTGCASNRPVAHRRVVVAALAVALAACASGLQRDDVARDSSTRQPEAPSGFTDKQAFNGRRFAVATANPLASEAGQHVIEAGGSAIDAAIAAQMVLTLVEPQASGIGGGAFILHWDGTRVEAFDGRETAPALADERLFLRPDGKPMAFLQAAVGGRSVGVPGVVRMLELAHARHGRLPWARLFEPAIELADRGFAVSPRLHQLLRAERPLRAQPNALAFYYDPRGEPWPVGYRLKNPALAAVLRAIAQRGSDAFHRGPIAQDLVRRVQGSANPGRLSEEDMANYRPVQRDAMCDEWTGRRRVCGFPPPSSGHLALMQMLRLLQHGTPPDSAPLHDGVPAAPWLHLYSEAARLAYADRDQYVADPGFVAAPAGSWRSLLDDAYLRQRAALIGSASMKTAPAGVPAGSRASFAPQADQYEYGTSHLSIVDTQGHAVAMTTTVEAMFGSRILADGGTGLPGGYLLNNQLTDFSFAPAAPDGRAIANRVQPGKRPRSSMTPTLVFDRDGRLLLSAGSPGGAMIIHYTAKALLASLDWGLDAQQALALPNFGSLNGPTLLERGRFPASTVEALRARGHVVQEVELTSGVQLLLRSRDGWSGAADPRREGAVRGE